ncbi:MAG: Gfo/Idh/MocA family oxidoreductase [Planctomycetota bacterium]
MRRNRLTRRRFLKRTLVAGAGLMIVPRRVLGGPGQTPPSEEITHGIIGCGGICGAHLRMNYSRLLALCDVDEKRLANRMKGRKGVKGYRDFREMIDRKDIDVIHVATPPHWHSLMSVMAAKAGKDVWCEKPMTRTIGEGSEVRDTIKRHGRMFRINTWFRFTSNFYGLGGPVKLIKQVVENGMLGWPIKVTVSGITGFNWKHNWMGRTNLKPEPVPADLDYDMWLGPAPRKPYNPARVHGRFRGYWDYDGGGLGDMGMHYLDPVQYIMGKDDTSPVETEADAPLQHPDAVRRWRRVRMKYADGCEIILDGDNSIKDAAFVEGPDGKVFRGFKSTIPNIRRKVSQLPEPAPQQTDFADTVRNRKTFALNESNAHRSCTLINLAKIAIRMGRPIRYDPVKECIIGDEEANRLINQPMRAPWHL